MNLPTNEIAFAHAVRYRDAMLHAWMRRTGQGNSYRPEDVPAYLATVTNEDRSRAEVIEFKLQPLPYGESYVAYLKRDMTDGRVTGVRVTTWTGETLANVTSLNSSRVWNSIYTDTRGSFWAKGIDGRVYYGRHNGEGMYCRMRLAKHQPGEKRQRKSPLCRSTDQLIKSRLAHLNGEIWKEHSKR